MGFAFSSGLAYRALDAAPDAMVIIDEAGKVCFANRQVSALFGYAREDIVGESVEALMPERFRSQHAAHRRDYLGNVRVRPMGGGLELFGRRRDGAEFPIEISLSPIADNGGLLVAAAIRDLTDRKRAADELIEARTAAEHARASAERANKDKRRFLATASHDLRQPLQTLSLLNGTLRRTAIGADVRDALAHQEEAIGAMSRLLNALLDISKLESGAIKPQLTDFTVAALFEELRSEFDTVAAGKGLRLDIARCDESAHSDPHLVGQILRNLLSNAIKYTREGWVRLQCLHEAASIRIEVLDTGIGIPAEHIPHICEEFYQVDPARRSQDGYGLGLSIVQRLVSLLTLKLEVRSEVGKGSAFSLLLPATSGPAATTPRVSNRGLRGVARAGTSQVLLVEDDFAVRSATKMLLQTEGYNVSAVGSLDDALQVAHTGDVDLLVVDYHLMHGETGVQVIARLREELGEALKSVLMTGDTSMAIRELPRDPNLCIVSKPVNADELLTLIESLLTSETPPSQ